MSEQPVPIEAFHSWLLHGERGASSETIVTHLTGVPITQRSSHPYDPSDFRRCERLLRAVPAAAIDLHRMSDLSPVWARFVAAWDELVALGESEAPGIFGSANGRGSASRMYARMQEIRQGEATS
jgi:hypothetical protein